MEKNKSRFVMWLLIVIIIFLITLIGGLIINIKNKNNTQAIEETMDNNENKVTSDDNIVDEIVKTEQSITNINEYGVTIPDDKDVHVYSYIDQQKVIEKGSVLDTNLTISLRIPQLKYDTQAAKKINEDILGKFENYIKAFNENKFTSRLADMELTANYDYIYTVSENRIYLNVSKGFGCSNASGSFEEYTYIYDISNDKQISLSEVLVEKGITVDKIIEQLYNDYNFNVSYGNDEEAKKSVREALNKNFSNVTLDDIEVDKNFENRKFIYLNVSVYRDSYRLGISI